MTEQEKARILEERTRKKYARRENRTALARERRMKVRFKKRDGRFLKAEQERLKRMEAQKRLKNTEQQKKLFEERRRQQLTKEQQKRLEDVHKIHHPKKLEAALKKAKESGIESDLLKNDEERLAVMNKTSQHLDMFLNTIGGREATASEKDAMQSIRSGNAEAGMTQLKNDGQNSAVGNQVGQADTKIAEEMRTLQKHTGKEFGSALQDILSNSVPGASFNQAKRQDGGDQNRTGDVTKKSTGEEMLARKMQERKLRAA